MSVEDTQSSPQENQPAVMTKREKDLLFELFSAKGRILQLEQEVMQKSSELLQLKQAALDAEVNSHKDWLLKDGYVLVPKAQQPPTQPLREV